MPASDEPDLELELEDDFDESGAKSSDTRYEIVVDSEQVQARMRLDRFLKAALEKLCGQSMSRTQLQRLIQEGRVTVNGLPAKPSLELCGQEQVVVLAPAPVDINVQAEDIAIEVVFEDSDLLVVNKPAGMVVHPGAGVHSGTLVNALLFHCKDSLSGIGGVVRPGIVHRLDKDTSGLIVVAKHDRAHVSLSHQISEKQATRIYLALVEGQPPERGTVDKPIARHKTDRKKMAVVASGRKAVTQFEVLSRFDKFCLVKCKLATGRTHQIRVHMESLNCPVVGDIVYNRKTTGSALARQQLGLVGHALHATYLAFTHPTSSALLEFEAPPPADFGRLIDSLGADPRHVT